MYHSITFYPFDSNDSYNTWDDWHLIPTKRPHVGPPEIEYPYQNELLYRPIDITNAGNVGFTYKSRSASWEFAVANGYHDWAVLYRRIMVYLHGKSGRFVLEDSPAYYYVGRFIVKNWDSGESYSTITIEALCEPFLYMVENGRTTLALNSMADKSYNFNYNTPYGEVPIIFSAKVKESRSALGIYGLFTNRSSDSRNNQYLQINDVVEGHTYVINAENKTVIDENDSTGVRQNAMHKVGHMIAFPTLIDGINKLRVVGTPSFSSNDKVDVTISLLKRSL